MVRQPEAHFISTVAAAPVRPITYAPVAVEQTRRSDGSILLRTKTPLAPFEPNLVKMFRTAVETAPSARCSPNEMDRIGVRSPMRMRVNRLTPSLLR